MPIEVAPLDAALGARITGIDLSRPLSDIEFASVHAAWLDHQVLIFPDQNMDDEDQVRFSQLFGDLPDKAVHSKGTKSGQQLHKSVMLVTNIREDGEVIGSLPDGEMHFHSDGMHRDRPYRATSLYAIKVPAEGGDTMFSSQAAAYDDLSTEMQEKLDGLQGRHVFNYNKTTREEMRTDLDDSAFAVHSLVKTNPDSGRKSLYLSRLMTRDIIGLEKNESNFLGWERIVK